MNRMLNTLIDNTTFWVSRVFSKYSLNIGFAHVYKVDQDNRFKLNTSKMKSLLQIQSSRECCLSGHLV